MIFHIPDKLTKGTGIKPEQKTFIIDPSCIRDREFEGKYAEDCSLFISRSDNIIKQCVIKDIKGKDEKLSKRAFRRACETGMEFFWECCSKHMVPRFLIQSLEISISRLISSGFTKSPDHRTYVCNSVNIAQLESRVMAKMVFIEGLDEDEFLYDISKRGDSILITYEIGGFYEVKSKPEIKNGRVLYVTGVLRELPSSIVLIESGPQKRKKESVVSLTRKPCCMNNPIISHWSVADGLLHITLDELPSKEANRL